MLEIIALIFLCRRIGAKAIQKGQPKGKWQAFTVIAWIVFEIVGAVIGFSISHDLILAGMLGLACATGGYLLAKYRLDQYQDIPDENWMDRLGKEDRG